MGIDPTVVRIGVVVASLFGGIGVAVYVAGWLFVPLEGEDEAPARRALGDRRSLALATATATAVEVVLVVADLAGVRGPVGWGWPVSLAAGGLVLVWRDASPDDRQALGRLGGHLAGMRLGGRSRRLSVARVLVGVGLVLVGAAGLMGLGRHVRGSTGALIGAAVAAAGFVLVLGPWWLRLARELAAERRERVRSQERAEVAAHLHDSVLQTLALIQRSAGNPREVTRLARAQERELRSWLFEERAPGAATADEPPTLSEAVARMADEVELRHGTPVEHVVVGDAAMDDDLRALVAAAREAAVNAAKWSGAERVSVFAEVEPHGASVFVRDRGRGFDPEAVAPDRRGIRESIEGRVERRGGKVVIRTAPGEGTEVEIVLPRRRL